MRRIFKSDNFAYFIRYFGAFTLIFVLMTAIILQVFRGSIYQTSDENFKKIMQSPRTLLAFAQARGFESNLTHDFDDEFDKNVKLNANYYVLLYDKSGNIVNQVEPLSGLSSIALEKNKLGEISEKTVYTRYGAETYRMMTVSIRGNGLQMLTGEDIAYATILYHTTQLKASIEYYNTIVIAVMISFWLISIFVSLYLSNLSLRPLRASYQKQKEFVENASHELRTPLAVLQNRLEALFRKPDATILESSESIASSLEEVRNMRKLTSNLLDLARRDDGLKTNIESISADFFETMFHNFEMVASESGKQFSYNLHLPQAVRSDKSLLKQLLTILFDNAIKYTEDAGQIHMEVLTKDRHLYLTVADNGEGIRPGDREKIFERFYRVDKARTRQNGGFGLGLSLAKQIVLALKGSISVRDNQPKGTIFEVKL